MKRKLSKRKRLILCVILFLAGAARARGDGVDVSASLIFSATTNPYCASTCTETLDTTFQYSPPSASNNYDGSLRMLSDTSYGFLGSFGRSYLGQDNSFIAFLNGQGDEIDIPIPYDPTHFGPYIAAGENTVGFFMYSCQSLTCNHAYGESWINFYFFNGSPLPGTYTWESTSIATPLVATPEPSSMLLPAIGLLLLPVFAIAKRTP
jgi:hypothetical protein